MSDGSARRWSATSGLERPRACPGRVPGAYAPYDKVVDASGATVGYTKTTVLPDGAVLHTEDELSP